MICLPVGARLLFCMLVKGDTSAVVCVLLKAWPHVFGFSSRVASCYSWGASVNLATAVDVKVFWRHRGCFSMGQDISCRVRGDKEKALFSQATMGESVSKECIVSGLLREWKLFSCASLQINRAPSFSTDQRIDYDVKKGALLNALKLLNIR